MRIKVVNICKKDEFADNHLHLTEFVKVMKTKKWNDVEDVQLQKGQILCQAANIQRAKSEMREIMSPTEHILNIAFQVIVRV